MISKFLSVHHVPSYDQPEDILTKALSPFQAKRGFTSLDQLEGVRSWINDTWQYI